MVDREQSPDDLFIAYGVWPAIGVEHGLVKRLVSELKPRWALIVEGCERPRLAQGLGDARWSKPAITQAHEIACGGSDCFHKRAVHRFSPRRLGERERLEGTCWRVAKTALNLTELRPRPARP